MTRTYDSMQEMGWLAITARRSGPMRSQKYL
jgi:hypothetical protein